MDVTLAGAHARDVTVESTATTVENGVSLARGATLDRAGASSVIAVDHSATPAAIGLDQGTGAIEQSNRLAAAPTFVHLEAGDFHLVPGTALVDAATPGGRAAGATDLDGRPSTADGDGNCVAVPDVGAFVLPGLAFPPAPAPPAPPTTSEPPPAPSAPTVRRVKGLRISPSELRSGLAVPRLVSRPAHRPAATISFVASGAGTVTLRFERLGKRGRPTKSQALKVDARPGLNRIRFSGRLSRRSRLRPGRYRVSARLSGQRTAPPATRLTIAPSASAEPRG